MPADYDFDDFLIKQRKRVQASLERITHRSRSEERRHRATVLQELQYNVYGGTIASTSAMGPRKPTLSELDNDKGDF